MAHTVQRLPTCANCGYDFVAAGGPDHFCPSCGQENHDLNISFGHLVEETLEGLFHFDSKFFRTLGLLLFLPGRLTRRFNQGHRVAYVPPIRLYVFTSFVFFLVLSLLSGHDERRLADTALAANQTSELALDSVADEAQKRKIQNLEKKVGRYRFKTTTSDSASIGPVSFSLAELDRYAANPTTARADSMLRSKGQEPTWWKRIMLRQAARMQKSTIDQLVQRLFKNLSVAMFVLMPLFALLLKGLYVRRKRLYINHLIFALHLHCFMFVLILVSVLWERVAHNDWLDPILSLALPCYLVLALHHVYQQSWAKTFAKAFVLGTTYLLVLLFVLVSVLAVSFAQL